jgi:hypothetical protein
LEKADGLRDHDRTFRTVGDMLLDLPPCLGIERSFDE